jgi:hypothetical protein
MSNSRFADRAPDVLQLTAYDESHLADYLRLLDADDEGVTGARLPPVFSASTQPRNRIGRRRCTTAILRGHGG